MCADQTSKEPTAQVTKVEEERRGEQKRNRRREEKRVGEIKHRIVRRTPFRREIFGPWPEEVTL